MMMNKILIALVLAVVMGGNAYAQTLETNIEGVVIKGFDCDIDSCKGTIVNRTNQIFGKSLISIKLFDHDDDPIGDCYGSVFLKANSGTGFYAIECNGGRAETATITVTEY
jgi:hypothetical protein